MMEYVLNEYDDLIEKPLTAEIRQHIIEVLDAVYLVAELDSKEVSYRIDLKERKAMRNQE